VPQGTTAQRPGSPTDGFLRYNTDNSYLEVYIASLTSWEPISTSSGGNATLSDVTGGQTQLSTTPYAVSLLTTTLKSDAIDSLNHIVGKLLPAGPTAFPGSYTLSVTSVGTTPVLAAGAVPNNTNGGTLPATDGQSVTRTTGATVSSNTIGTGDDVGPGDSGTVTALVNNTASGNVTLATGSQNGTYTSLVISNDQNYGTPSGFHESFRAAISNATVAQGWNRIQITDTGASNTNIAYFVTDNVTAAPVVTGGVVTNNTLGTTASSSGVVHYGTGAVLNLASVTMTNLAGETYYNGSPITVASTTAFNADTAPITTQTYTYTNVGVTTPIARQTTTAQALTTMTVSVNATNTHTAGTLTYQGTNVNGSSSVITVASPIILLKNGTAKSTEVNEQTITGSSVNAARSYLGSSGTGDTPTVTLSSATAWTSTQDLSAAGYLHEAVVSGGVLRQDTTNYSSGYLPANTVNYSTKNATQYFTFVFNKTALSNITVTLTGNYAGLWIALPGVSDNATISPAALGGVWWNAFALYNGAGVPGRTGDTPAGCANGSVASGATGAVALTFGTQSSTNATGNKIYVRVKLTSGQRITAISLTN
jgi:hypothetical protein